MKKVIVIAILALTLAGCYDGTASKEQQMTERNQEHLLDIQPPTQLDWSLERENINKRTKLWNDPNKVSYIYLISYGKVMAFYVIKGKASSVNSQITNPEQLIRTPSGRYLMPSPAEDGSYGENGDAIFFFTTDGAYVEWAGEYMLADKPLKMATAPTLVRTID